MRDKRIIGILVALMLGMHGCASLYSVVEFEVLNPASVSLPENVHQLLVMNRAPFTRDAFEKSDIEGLSDRQLVMVDTLIVNNLCRGLLEVLQQSPIERFHHPLWLSDRSRDTAMLEDLILTRREVDALCRENASDAILSLESYNLNLDIHSANASFADAPFTSYFELSIKVKWIIYLPGNPRPFDMYTLADTLYFTEYLNGEFIRSYSSPEMIRESCYRSGNRYGRYLVPAWNHTDRVIFRGRESSLKLAAKSTDDGDWEEAYDLWEQLIHEDDSTLVAKAYHNMAVYYELEDNIDSASHLIGRAMEYDSLEIIRNYQEELEIRILNRKDIYKQVR